MGGLDKQSSGVSLGTGQSMLDSSIDEILQSHSHLDGSEPLKKLSKPYRRRHSHGTMLHMFQNHAFSRGLFTKEAMDEDARICATLPKSIQPNDLIGTLRGTSSYKMASMYKRNNKERIHYSSYGLDLTEDEKAQWQQESKVLTKNARYIFFHLSSCFVPF